MADILEVEITKSFVLRAYERPVQGSTRPIASHQELAFSIGPKNGEHDTRVAPEAVTAILAMAAEERDARRR